MVKADFSCIYSHLEQCEGHHCLYVCLIGLRHTFLLVYKCFEMRPFACYVIWIGNALCTCTCTASVWIVGLVGFFRLVVKRTVAWDFLHCFFAGMDSFRPDCEPLLVVKFNNSPPILDIYLKFWCVSGQTFSEILRISEMDWQLWVRGSPRKFVGITIFLETC